MGEPIIAPSARIHDVADDDMLHALRNAVRAFDEDEGFTMLIGPARDSALLEVGIVDGAEGPVIVHAMTARANYLRWMGGG